MFKARLPSALYHNVVNAGDFIVLTSENVFCKCKNADDTYIVPANIIHSSSRELYNIQSWTCAKNLKLSLKEVIFVALRRRVVQPVSLLKRIPRVSSGWWGGVAVTRCLDQRS